MARSKYPREFKEEAVKLAMSGAKRVKDVAGDLGISTNMLHRWIGEYGRSPKPFPGNGKARDEEMARLRQALKQAEMERDILKKAAAYFAQHLK